MQDGAVPTELLLDHRSADFGPNVRKTIDEGRPFAVELRGPARSAVRKQLRGQTLDWASLVTEAAARPAVVVAMLASTNGASIRFDDDGARLRIEVVPVRRPPLDEVATANEGEPSMQPADVERRLGLNLPAAHLRTLADPKDALHARLELLYLAHERHNQRLGWVNALLRARPFDPWPTHLVAFASNGCGDYYAYDLRTDPPRIVYIDPDRTIEENDQSEDRLEYESFDAFASARRRR